MINIKKFTFNEFQENTYVLFDDAKECVIVDAGCNSVEEEKKLINFLNDKKLKPVKLINTHGHVDHIMGIKFLIEKYNIPYYLHKNDVFLINEAQDHAVIFGFHIEKPPLPDKYITDNNIVNFGNSKLKVIHTPGHSPGGVCFYAENEKILFAGDTLFFTSIGRTDLPGGNHNTLLNSIKNKIFTLPDNVKVYSGHGNETSVGYEKNYNPFINGL